jgi:hypothetical protein
MLDPLDDSTVRLAFTAIFNVASTLRSPVALEQRLP